MGSSVEAEIEAEQRYVDRVYERLDELVARAQVARRDGQARGKLDYTGEIKEEDYRNLFERDVMVDHAVRRLALLDAQREGLVFGRLDNKDEVVRYVGRIGIRDEEQEPLVIDWRAPAAAVFYQATPVQPMGVIRRRVLRSMGQQVIGVEDDLLDPDAAPDDMQVIGDGALMAALTAARGSQMRDIVATIQREQDEIVRAPSRGATLISGGPGTGKTVVALHRAAYLLYSERQRIAGGGILVVGPSSVFMSYIERVLPSLGEHDATLRSLGEVHDGIVATRLDPFDVAAVKGSLRMRTILQRAARDNVPGAPTSFRVFAYGRALRLDAGELDRIRRNVLSKSSRHNPTRREATRAVLDALWRKTARGEVGRNDFADNVGEHDEFLEFMDAWWPYITAKQVFGWLKDSERLHGYARGVLKPRDTSLLLSSWASGELSVQDVPLIDELYALLGPIPQQTSSHEDELVGVFDEFIGDVSSVADRISSGSSSSSRAIVDNVEQYDGYAHILVDEAQDLSPMQWRMLGRRAERASWTIVGDPAQSSWPDLDEATRARDAALGKRPRRIYRLSTNYRNSAEIFDLAHKVIRTELTDIDLPKAVRRTGEEPVLLVVSRSELADSVRSSLTSLLSSVEGTVGVVATVARQAEVASWIAPLDQERVFVLPPLATKGLEYDAVLVVEPTEIARENPVGVRTLYVVLTRATQKLLTIGTDNYWLEGPDEQPAADTLF